VRGTIVVSAARGGPQAVNAIDATIQHWLQGYVQKSWVFDNLVCLINDSSLFRGSVFATILWYLWFHFKTQRDRVVAAFASSILAVIVARIIAVLCPFRTRPLFDAAVHFRPAFEGDGVYKAAYVIGWSSFPSDHAVLFMALATGFYFISRRAGILAGVYAIAAVAFPRVYLGIHYPTDIFVGCVIGIALGAMLQTGPVRGLISRRTLAWSEQKPELFYASAFLVTSQMATLFWEPHSLLRKLVKGLKPSWESVRHEVSVIELAGVALCVLVAAALGTWLVYHVRNRPKAEPVGLAARKRSVA